MVRFVLVVGFFCLLTVAGRSAADDHVEGPYCGQQKCKKDYYCNKFDTQCAHCSTVCSPDHNYDQGRCLSECQVYFYDQRYYKRDVGDTSNTIAQLKDLQVKTNVLLGLLIIVIIAVILLSAVVILILKQQKNLNFNTIRDLFKKKNDKSNGIPNNSVPMDQTDRKADLKIEIPPSSVQSESPTTVTTGISRIPAEDSIDYAYDNPAMSNSPKTTSSS